MIADIKYQWDLISLILKEWLKTYTRRRYGKAVHQVEEAWEILHRTIYNCTDGIAVCFPLNSISAIHLHYISFKT